MPKYKHGKQTKPITFQDFESMMRAKCFRKKKRVEYKSFVAFLYWFGVRKSEALERMREDFKITKSEIEVISGKVAVKAEVELRKWKTDSLLIVDATPKKGGEREPLEVPTDYPYVDLIIEQVNRTKPNKRVWSFHPNTAINIVKKVMGEKYYPHFFRLNRATRFLDDPKTTLPQMKAWFGWKASKTVDPYIGYSRRHVREMRGKLAQELE